MRRREFIALAGRAALSPMAASAAAWPIAARAQQRTPVIGFLGLASAATYAPFVEAFREGLSNAGYIDGRNVAIEFRWAEGDRKKLPALAADLVRRRVNVIVASGGPPVAEAARAASATVPIVFASGTDPVKAGLVTSLNRPGGNTTGIALVSVSLESKRVGLLHELLPKAKTIGLLSDPTGPSNLSDVQRAARDLGLRVIEVQASDETDFEASFTTLVQQRAQALIVNPSPIFASRRSQLAALALRHGMPTIFEWRDFVTAGGLMSYGSSLPDGYRQVGIYTGRVLSGVKPADLPIIEDTRVELTINLKTAKALGLEVPPMLIATADEVIE